MAKKKRSYLLDPALPGRNKPARHRNVAQYLSPRKQLTVPLSLLCPQHPEQGQPGQLTPRLSAFLEQTQAGFCFLQGLRWFAWVFSIWQDDGTQASMHTSARSCPSCPELIRCDRQGWFTVRFILFLFFLIRNRKQLRAGGDEPTHRLAQAPRG